MVTTEAILCTLCIAVLSLDRGQCARNKISEESVMRIQSPRFIAAKRGRTITLQCGYRCEPLKNTVVSWYRGNQNGSVISYIEPEPHIKLFNTCLTIQNVQRKDNGIYFCTHNTSGVIKKSLCGTELMIVGCGNVDTARARNTMKDAIIVIQTILIVLFVVVPITLLKEMNKKRSLKIEDHLYEGLEAYQAATYEDIQNVRVLAAKTMEGEHPCLE